MAYSGVLKILRFNWPWYAGAFVATLVGGLMLRSGALRGPWTGVVISGLLLADFWIVVSLVVSHVVYDRSPVSRGEWLDCVNSATVRSVAVFHGGLNEAISAVARLLPSAEVRSFDFYDPARKGTPSLARARVLVDPGATAMPLDRIPLIDGGLDLGLVVFAAHEIRRHQERAVFFGELARVLAPGGRILVVEHLRDGWNFLAYGPGTFHFLSRATWTRAFSDGGLRLLGETACTRFVRVFELGKGP